MTEKGKKFKSNDPSAYKESPLEKHLLMDDVTIAAMPTAMQIKVGAYLSNLMVKSLKFKMGNNKFLLLKTQIIKGMGKNSKKYIGYVTFNKGFVEQFITELDKIHDLNLQLERSLPMIYPPAPWKNFYFGGYYLRQTKLAKVEPQFHEAVKYLIRADIQPMCQVLDILGSVKWKMNHKILDTMEYVWSIGGGLGGMPKRYNERTITPEMIKDAAFRDKLKLLKDHQYTEA